MLHLIHQFSGVIPFELNTCTPNIAEILRRFQVHRLSCCVRLDVVHGVVIVSTQNQINSFKTGFVWEQSKSSYSIEKTERISTTFKPYVV